MTERVFRVTGPGIYRCRNGDVVQVAWCPGRGEYHWSGRVPADNGAQIAITWQDDGHWLWDRNEPHDLVARVDGGLQGLINRYKQESICPTITITNTLTD